MKLPTNLDKEKIHDFFIKLKERYKLNKDLITHIKFSEYSISIPDNKEEFFSFFEDLNWDDIYYISFFVKKTFLIKFDFLEGITMIKSESNEMGPKLKSFIKDHFNL